MSLWKINPGLLATRSGTVLNRFSNSIGEPIHCQYWEPDGKVRGMVMMVHGFAEHCGRYDAFSKQLNKLGLLAFSHDHVRHGKNPGVFDIVDYKQFIKDTLQHVHIMKEKHPDVPMYIFGHSMGGCISVFAASEQPKLFKGVILTGPMLTIDPQFTRVKVTMASAFRNLLPNLAVGEIKPELLSRDVHEVEKYVNDPLVYHGPVRLRTGYQMYLMAVDVQDRLGSITQPLLIMHGGNDEICDIHGSRNLFSESMSDDKKLRVFEGAKHELLFESDNVPADVVDEVISWISQRLGSSAV